MVVVLLIALLLAPAAQAQDLGEPVGEGVAEQSCRLLQGGTAGIPDQAEVNLGDAIPANWAAAPAGLLPARIHLRTARETFNRRFEFATRGGSIYVRARGASGSWRQLPVPACFAGRVESISADDDELIALDTARRVFTLDNILKGARVFNWTARWGTPFWTGLGYTLPDGVRAWSWSVVSLLEDGSWTDPAGNRTPIGGGKVSHIWGLRSGGQRLTFWDPWLPLDESYEMCGPHRGRFKALNMSASGSFVFVIGRRGDLFTRLYDFDISGHDPVFFDYSYEDQRGKGDGAPIQLPAEAWVEQPKIPGTITSQISIHKTGKRLVHRILRVEGMRDGRTGYWQRDVASPRAAGWSFHPTNQPLTRGRLDNPRRDTSARGLGPDEDGRYVLRSGGTGELADFNVYCSPARLLVGGKTLRLHHVDGLRQRVRGRGLDGVPRTQYGAIEDPGGRFSDVTVRATRSEIVIPERGWRFERVSDPPCLARRVRVGRRGIGRVRLGRRRARLPEPTLQSRRSWRWCVAGGGRVVAAFTKSGRVAIVATTARGHRIRRVRTGSRVRTARRAFPRRVRVGRGLFRVTPRSRRLFRVRRGRVRYVGVVSRRALARRARLRAYLRLARP